MSGEQHFEQKNMQKQTAKLETAHTLTRRLADYAAGQAYPFHMPGHKGGPVPLMAELKWMTPIDLTELPPTGNLYEGGEPFASAQATASA